MSIYVVGGDFLGSIPSELEKSGFTEIRHFQGRKVLKQKNFISPCMDLILVLTDYVGSDLSRTVKEQAKKHSVKIAFARRSWSNISKELDRLGFSTSN